ncbi:hypothetical protein ACWEEL_39445, partial [Streptomyces sp. NPDC005009]
RPCRRRSGPRRRPLPPRTPDTPCRSRCPGRPGRDRAPSIGGAGRQAVHRDRPAGPGDLARRGDLAGRQARARQVRRERRPRAAEGDRAGAAKLVPECTYPLTGAACVHRVYTDHGVFAPGPDGVRVLETYGITAARLRERLDVDLLR